MSSNKPTNSIPDAELRPYGFTRGACRRWCAACGRENDGMGEKAFKCRPCAAADWRDVERALLVAGDLPTNPVPAEYAEFAA